MNMDIIAPKRVLIERLTAAASVVEKKNPVATLTNIRLVAADGSVQISGSDGARSLVCSTGSDGVTLAQPGGIGLHAKLLLERVKTMPDGPVQIQVENDGWTTMVRAVGAARRFRFTGIPPTDFTELPSCGNEPPTLIIAGDALADLIGRIRATVSTDESRPHVNSALFELMPDRLRVVATDGHRAIYAQRQVTGLPAGAPIFSGRTFAEVLVPLKALGDIKSLVEGSKEPVTMTVVRGRDAFFKVGAFVLSVRLIETSFPPYRQAFPSESDHPIRVNRVGFLERVRAVALASDTKTGGVKITTKRGRLVFDADTVESGTGHDEMEAEYTGPEVTVGLSASYLVDAVDGIRPREGSPGEEADEVKLFITGELDPIVVRPAVNDPEMEIVAIVMPMRI